MTTTFAHTSDHVISVSEARSRTRRPLWQLGLAAGAIAATANVVGAAVARGFDVSLELTNSAGHAAAIPIGGFATMTLFGAVVGVILAAGARRFAQNPATRFAQLAVVGTVMTLVPAATLAHDTATMLVLWFTHLVAAAIIVPVLAARLRGNTVQ